MDLRFAQNPDESLRCLLLACSLVGDFKKVDKLLIIKELFLGRENSPLEKEQLVEKLSSGINQKIWSEACRTMDEAAELGVELLSPLWPGYPPDLLEIPDPPALLFLRGSLRTSCGVAIVGARRCSSYGSRIAVQFGRALREAGASIVSGLAMGIDAAAHRGALEAQERIADCSSPAIAVLGSGVCSIHPRCNQGLAEEILAAGGAVISEYGLRRTPRKHYYPRRNRIISGLSKKVLVVEAAMRSGSLITARLALEQGRDVAAIPGSITSVSSEGANRLIQNGAQLVLSARDVIDDLPGLPRQKDSKSPSESVSLEKRLASLRLPDSEQALASDLLRELSAGELLSIDQLAESQKASVEQLRLLLGRLELQGLIICQYGRYALGESIDNC